MLSTETICDTIGEDCCCNDERCKNLKNTVCNMATGACECDKSKGYVYSDGTCVKPKSKCWGCQFIIKNRLSSTSSTSCLSSARRAGCIISTASWMVYCCSSMSLTQRSIVRTVTVFLPGRNVKAYKTDFCTVIFDNQLFGLVADLNLYFFSSLNSINTQFTVLTFDIHTFLYLFFG